MKKMSLAAVAFVMAFGLTGCFGTYGVYDDGYGYGSYGYGTEYIILNNGYTYGYSASVIDEITRRMIVEMALDHQRAERLRALTRRYFYIFHSMPNYSFGYYNFHQAGPIRNNSGASANGRGMSGQERRVDMSERQLQSAAKEYSREVRNIVGKSNYSTFEKNVRSSARSSKQSVNAVRSSVSNNSGRSNSSVRSNNSGSSSSKSSTRSKSSSSSKSTKSSTRSKSSSSGTSVRSSSTTRNNNSSTTTNSTTRRTRDN